MRLTTPAPSHAPVAAVNTMQMSKAGCTVTTLMNSTVSRNAAGLSPTLSVPGISSSLGYAAKLEQRGRRCERADAEGVEEGSDGADGDVGRAGPAVQAVTSDSPHPADDEGDIHHYQRNEQPDSCSRSCHSRPEQRARPQPRGQPRQSIDEAQVLDRGACGGSAQRVQRQRQHGCHRKTQFHD